MYTKIKRTTFGVTGSHIISSFIIFPFLWIIIGSLGKVLSIKYGLIEEPYATILYYSGLILSYYFGIKFSLFSIDKRVIVPDPKKTAIYSISIFFLLLCLMNYAFFYYENVLNYYRIVTSFILIYMFASITKKYFDSLEQVNYKECNFISQIFILSANFSFLIMLFLMLMSLSKSTPIIQSLLLFLITLSVLIIQHLAGTIYIPFFYTDEKKKPFKIAIPVLIVTFLCNLWLLSIITEQFH